MTDVLGLDLSYANPTEPKLDGLSFVIGKASEGNFTDRLYQQHHAAARKAGLAFGAYHFGREEWSVETQVNLFLATATDADFLNLDYEHSTVGTLMTEPQARAFIKAVKARDHRKLLLYGSYENPWPIFPSDCWGADGAWIAAPGFEPSVPYVIVQYGQRGLDRDRFNGTPAEFAAFLGKPVEVADPMTNLFPLTAHRVVDLPAGTVLQATPGGSTYSTVAKAATLGLIGATATHFCVADGDQGVYVARAGLTPRTADVNAGK